MACAAMRRLFPKPSGIDCWQRSSTVLPRPVLAKADLGRTDLATAGEEHRVEREARLVTRCIGDPEPVSAAATPDGVEIDTGSSARLAPTPVD